MTKFTITQNDENQTIFKFIKKVYSTTPLSVIYKWFRKKDIRLNGKRITDQKIKLKTGDKITVFDTNSTVKRDKFNYVENNHIEVVYEDENMLIVNKAPNVEMHSEFNICLDDMVKTYLVDKKEYNPDKETSFVVSHVHRLDKLTQGLVMYAKNKATLDELLLAIKDKEKITKEYVLKTKTGFPQTLQANGWIYYDNQKQLSVYNQKQVADFMKESKTTFSLIKENESTSLVNAKIETGRKHQIRATLAFFGFPIINDFRYGGQKVDNERMIFLKAYRLTFNNFIGDYAYLNGKEISLSYDFEN